MTRIQHWIFALLFLLAFKPANAQGLFGTISDAPQHAFSAGAGCDGNGHCSGDVGFAEKISGATYSYNAVEFVPSMVTNSAGKQTLSIKPVLTSGVEQIVYQGQRVTVAVSVAGGSSMRSANLNSFNFTTAERATVLYRLNNNLRTDPGASNNYIAVTPSFTQIVGVPDGQTFVIRLHWVHGVNGN